MAVKRTKKISTKGNGTKKTGTKKKKTNGSKIKVLESTPIIRVEPDEFYMAKLIEAEVRDSKKFVGTQYLWLNFELLKNKMNVQEDGKSSAVGARFSGTWGLPPTPKKKSYKILCALVGRKLSADDEVDVKAHLGKKYKVMISDSENTNDDGQFWQNISTLKAVKSKA